MSVDKFDILHLPLVPASERLTVNLLPDPVTPEPRSIVSVSASSPSLVRRSRPVGQGSHFSYLSTLPLSFPYDFPPEQEGELSLGDRHQKELEQDDDTDAVVMIGGGCGTLNELTISYAEARPVVILRGSGGWADRIEGVLYDGHYLDERHTVKIDFADTPEAVVELAFARAAMDRGQAQPD